MIDACTVPRRGERNRDPGNAPPLIAVGAARVLLNETWTRGVSHLVTPPESRTCLEAGGAAETGRLRRAGKDRSLVADYFDFTRRYDDPILDAIIRTAGDGESESREGTFRRTRRGFPSMRRIPDGLIPEDILARYEIYNWRNAAQVLAGAYPAEWRDILEILGSFVLRKSEVLRPGGRKSKISDYIDAEFSSRGWREREVSYKVSIDDETRESRTHKIDCYRNRIGLECEWNSKDQTFVRDLNTFRLLFDMQILDVGCIVTRSDHLQDIFDSLGPEIGKKYGPSTTHMGKLLPRLQSGGGGGCPVLAFGITRALYDPNS